MKKFLIPAAIVALGVLAIAYSSVAKEEKKSVAEKKQESKDVKKDKKEDLVVKKEDLLKVLPGDNVLGDAKAKILMIEYASLSCPHCADFSNKIFPEIDEKYIKTGKIRFVYRDFPLNEPAVWAAMVSHCSGKDRYYSFIKALFESQSKWAATFNIKNSIKKIAMVGGMPGDKFEECLNNKKLEDEVLLTRLKAEKGLQVGSTPTFFINDEKVNGYKDFSSFSKVIDSHLSKHKQ